MTKHSMTTKDHQVYPCDIAIVGIAVNFATAPSLNNFWHQLLYPNDHFTAKNHSITYQPEYAIHLIESALNQANMSEKNLLSQKTELTIISSNMTQDQGVDQIANHFQIDQSPREFMGGVSAFHDALSHGANSLCQSESRLMIVCALQENNSSCEGATLLLQKLETATEQNRPIYAVIKGSSSKNQTDTTTMASIELYPKMYQGPEALLSLKKTFTQRPGTMPKCTLGTLPESYQSPYAANLMARLIKQTLSLYHKVYPPVPVPTQNSIHPFYFNQEIYPWFHGNPDTPRRSACIYEDGTPIILEEWATPLQKQIDVDPYWPSELLLWTASSKEELLKSLKRWQQHIKQNDFSLFEVAHQLSQHKPQPHRLVIVAKDKQDLNHKIELAIQKITEPDRTRLKTASGIYYSQIDQQSDLGKTALMFPGNGSQYTNMMFDLCLHFPQVRAWFDELDKTFFMDDEDLQTSLLYPPKTDLNTEQKDRIIDYINDHEGGMQAGLIGSLSLYNLLKHFQIPCDLMFGYSNGENAALLNSGTWHTHEQNEIFRVMRQLKLEMRHTNAPHAHPPAA